MSDLEEKGYLYHPHTSAGRIPTDLAYRVYVDSRSVGMRPAEVWGWYRYPFSSRSLMVLRIVAEDRAMANRFEIVRLPAGSAVSTYVSITASSTCRSRSVRDFGMSPNLLITNNLDRRVGAGQVADESIEAEPPLGRANQPLAPHFGPALLSPAGRGGRWRMVEGVQREPRVGAQRQV